MRAARQTKQYKVNDVSHHYCLPQKRLVFKDETKMFSQESKSEGIDYEHDLRYNQGFTPAKGGETRT